MSSSAPARAADATRALPAQRHTTQSPTPAGVAATLALGASLVAYSALLGLWPARHNQDLPVVVGIREWLGFPLGIGEDFGMLGIALLLVAAGYLLTQVITTTPTISVLSRLLVRGYLPFAFAVTLSWLIVLGGGESFTEPRSIEPAPLPYLTNLVFADHLIDQPSLLGLGWVVTVAALFGVTVLGSTALLRRCPLTALSLQLGAVGIVVVTAPGADGWYHDLGRLAVYLSFPLLGGFVWAVHTGRATGWTVAPGGVGCIAVLIAAEHSYPAFAPWWYPLTAVYAVLILLVVIRCGVRWDTQQATRWLATRAYPLLLMTGTIGYTMMSALDALPVGVAMTFAMLGTVLAAEGVHRAMKVITP